MTSRFWYLQIGMVGFVLAISWPLLTRMIYWVTYWTFGWLPLLIFFIPLFFYLYRSQWLAGRIVQRCVRPEWVWRRSIATMIAMGALILGLGGLGTPDWFGPLRVGGQPVVLMLQLVCLTGMLPAPYLWASLDFAMEKDRKYRESEENETI